MSEAPLGRIADEGGTEMAYELVGRDGSSMVSRLDAKLKVWFHLEPKLDDKRTREEGRPIYCEREYITIVVPGGKDNIINRPVWFDTMNEAADNNRFRMQWKAFQENKKAGPKLIGTPLTAWPQIARAQVKELEFFNVQTVEELSELSDDRAQAFMGGNGLVARARDWLKLAKGGAVASDLRSKIEKLEDSLRAKEQAIEEQAKAIEELKKMVKQGGKS